MSAPREKVKRSGIACFPCRRGRRKCQQDVDGTLPCRSCIDHGREDLCVLATPGTSRKDREPRGIRFSAKRAREEEERAASGDLPVGAQRPSPDGFSQPSNSQSAFAASFVLPSALSSSLPAQLRLDSAQTQDDANGLPPLELIVEGCDAFFNGYFQLGFLNRPSFMHQLVTDQSSINPFLLLAILSISARFTPCLIERYGGRREAVDAMLVRAHAMLMTEMVTPTLEKVQAIYLLSLSDWGKGLGHRSRLLFGIALQMAEMIKLSTDDPSAGAIQTEVRRRTWWFLNCTFSLFTVLVSAKLTPFSNQVTSNSLNVSSNTPTILDPMTITIPLPSHEDDFAFGALSSPPTYFPGSPYALPTPDPRGISLLGVLLTIFVIWGSTSRALCGLSSDLQTLTLPPWHPDSLLESSLRKLHSWLARLSNKQKWSVTNLLAYKSANLDLALFSIFANFHLNHVALRRQYLPIMIKALHPLSLLVDSEMNGQMPPGGRAFWEHMATALVTHAFDTIELQSLVKKVRTVSLGSSPYMAFALYLSGTIVNYLRCCPWRKAQLAPKALAAALEILSELTDVWPMSQRWHETLVNQSTMSPMDISTGDRATAQASNDLTLDRSIGIFRQFAESSTSPGSRARSASLPDLQLAAASTLAQLGGGGGAGRDPAHESPRGLDVTMAPGFSYIDPELEEGAQTDRSFLDPFSTDLNFFLQGNFDYDFAQ